VKVASFSRVRISPQLTAFLSGAYTCIAGKRGKLKIHSRTLPLLGIFISQVQFGPLCRFEPE
jgi:hypothetical protein